MSLADLILKLKPLLDAPAQNFDEIVGLLDSHRSLAEYEVARYWVSRSMVSSLTAMARSADPRQRRQAATAVRLVCTRTRAAQLLRPLMKDGDFGVRKRAHHALNALDIDEVALPDARHKPPRKSHSRALGGWNPTGWTFGLFTESAVRRSRKEPAATARKTLLEKHKLPAMETAAELCKWLGLKAQRELRRFMRAGVGKGSPYVEFEIPKASGEMRKITAPRQSLKRIQRKILDEILAKLPVHPASHGFVRGRSVLTNAQPHEGAQVVVKMDLRDFFPTIHYQRVKGLFRRLGYNSEIAQLLAGLTTHRSKLADGLVVWPGALPQGAPTSPALANLLCLRLDARLSGLASRVGAKYTRYADDLTFSFRSLPAAAQVAEPESATADAKIAAPSQPLDAKGIGGFLWWVDQICQQEGFIENSAKRRVLWASNQQRVTGVVVNSGLHIPRAARHQFRALLHNCRMDGLARHARGRSDFRAYLLGFASYVKMVQPELGRKLLLEVKEVLAADASRASS